MTLKTPQVTDLFQDVRMVCNERGRCFETRGRVYRDYDEDYAVRPRYYGERREYYDEGPGVGFRFRFR